MITESSREFSFCVGGREMAERMRSYDWQSTSLGSPLSWPESLRLVLGVCFDSQFPIAVWWGPDLIQFYNDSYRPILGATKHPDAFGRSARETWPEIWPTIGPMVEQVMTKGEAVKGDDMPLVLDRNGYPELCHFTFSYSPIRDTSGAIVGMFTAAVETTNRVAAERRQAFQLALADRLRGLGDPDEITEAATELLGQYLKVSRVFYAEIDEAIGTFRIPARWIAAPDLPDLPATGRADDFSPALLKSLRAGKAFVVDDLQTDERMASYAHLYAALDIRSIVIVPLVKSGRLKANFNVADTVPRHWTFEDIEVITDVAERTWDAVERLRAEAELRAGDRLKDNFLAMLAHELRNPLAPISAAAQLLLLGQLDQARIKTTSEIISRQVKHMTGLVDDLLDVSRVTRGLINLEKVEVDIKHVATDALEQVRPLLESRRHQLVFSPVTGPAFVKGDKKRLVQVIANLLNNAAKYTPEGGIISLKAELQGEYVLLCVADSGIGMEPEFTDRAFNLFAQAERTFDRSQGGLGIGLALVKSLVDLHGGRVSARSAGLGKGSEFAVWLPRLAFRDERDFHGSMPFPTEEAKKPLRILVVDDNEDAATMLAMVVEAAGHEVSVENHARQALERARHFVPDVCLLDIGLPDIDGYELARQLRTKLGLRNAVLIAVTGYGQAQDRENSFAAGFDYHFTKPVDSAKLVTLLSEIKDSKYDLSR